MTECALCILRSPWFLGVAGSVIAFKLWMKLKSGKCKSDVRLDNKTVVVTGANSGYRSCLYKTSSTRMIQTYFLGIGLEAALDFAKRGARVVMVCRDMKKGEAAKQRIIEESRNNNISVNIMRQHNSN
jgi:hypothetical protein